MFIFNFDSFELTAPHFLSSILSHLSQPDCIKTDGLFRKAGSSARQKKLREEIEVAETFDNTANKDLDLSLSALDCGSILKKWLTELPEPLIPTRLHDVFLKCSNLPNPDDKINSLMLCTLLLPPLHSASLACLMRFLSHVAANSEYNKMDSRSLAIVFTPGLFHATGDEMSNGGHSTKTDFRGVPRTPSNNIGGSFNAKMDVVQALVDHSSRVCMVEGILDEALTIAAAAAICSFVTSQSEDNLDVDGNDAGGFAGPSERRRKRKKRRSGSLSRVLTATMKGLTKVISRSATPAGSRSNSTTNIAASSHNDALIDAGYGGSALQLSTPGFLRTPDSLCTPRMMRTVTAGNSG